MSGNLEKLKEKVSKLFELKKFLEIKELLNDSKLEKYNDSELFALRAKLHCHLNDNIDNAIYYAQKAIDTNSNFYLGYFARGLAWSLKEKNEKAIFRTVKRSFYIDPAF